MRPYRASPNNQMLISFLALKWWWRRLLWIGIRGQVLNHGLVSRDSRSKRECNSAPTFRNAITKLWQERRRFPFLYCVHCSLCFRCVAVTQHAIKCEFRLKKIIENPSGSGETTLTQMANWEYKLAAMYFVARRVCVCVGFCSQRKLFVGDSSLFNVTVNVRFVRFVRFVCCYCADPQKPRYWIAFPFVCFLITEQMQTKRTVSFPSQSFSLMPWCVFVFRSSLSSPA